MINAILISYGCVLKRSSKPVMKGSRVESIEEARKEYKKLLEEGWKKLIDSTLEPFITGLLDRLKTQP